MSLRAVPRPAIGVFDSGVGGLTVLRALRRRLPQMNFVYFGDTARVPYGRKPPAMVAGFASEIASFLCGLGVESLVVACNSASAAALPELAERCEVPVFGVIDPGVEAATQATRTGSVGVIGTAATIASGAYQRRLESQGVRVWARACPMLVHLVEEGLSHAPEAAMLVRHYLRDLPDIDTLILGCTHYPYLTTALAEVIGPGISLVDSAEAVAAIVQQSCGTPGRHTASGGTTHLVTGDPAAFANAASALGGLDGQVISVSLRELESTPFAGPAWPLVPCTNEAPPARQPNGSVSPDRSRLHP